MQDNTYRRAIIFGDIIRIPFFVHAGTAVMEEESYFFMMSCMRKMRMNIPLHFTLEFFQNIIAEEIQKTNVIEGRIIISVRREGGDVSLTKKQVLIDSEVFPTNNIFRAEGNFTIDILKEITVNTGLLSSIPVHSAEDIYAEIYAQENDLDDVILLNPSKRIARTGKGNLLLLHDNFITVPKTAEGAPISPLLESFVTFLHKNSLVELNEAEINPFETQKAEEVLIISDFEGIFYVNKIRNKQFSTTRFSEYLEKWEGSFTRKA